MPSSHPLPKNLDRLKALIGTPSVSSIDPDYDMGNLPVIELLANWLDQLGFKTTIQPISKGKANLIARIGEGQGGLVLSGHTDTVPYNADRWQSDPFSLTERENKFFGLGACDMKGFFSLAIEAYLRFQSQKLNKPLTIVATCDEESTMQGAKALTFDQLSCPDACIIGEPTELTPIRMHKSIMMNRLLITGKSGHSSNPDLGINAIDVMTEAMLALNQLKSDYQKSYKKADFAVQSPTMNYGCIHGGDNPNRICHQCALDFDFRGLPGMSNKDVLAEIKERIQPIADEHQAEFAIESLFTGVEPFEQAQDSELVNLTQSLSQKNAEAVAFATEAPFYKHLGIDTIVLGPGSIDQAHQPDEFLAFDQIDPCVTILEGLIGHYCL